MTIPEFEPIEIAEPVEPPAEPSPPPEPHVHIEGHPSAYDVIAAAVAQRLPCPVCASTTSCRCVPPQGYSATHERSTLIEQALILYGYLPSPQDGSGFDAEETAQWLADRSGFVRYTQVENGWRRLLEAEPDVELATIKALQRVPTDEVEMVKAAKAALLAWHQSEKV